MEERKVCKKCNIEKDISHFSKKYKTNDNTQRYQSFCKECVNKEATIRRSTLEYKENRSKYDKLYYDLNKEKVLKRKKNYHIKNKEIILQKKQIYRSKPENRERAKLYIKDYMKNNREKYYEYRRKSPHIIAWRQLLHRTLRYLGTKKEEHTQEILGYSAVQLKHHIEKQFKENMSWENYGEWEIDHIKPLTSFDVSSNPSEVNALSNLQPLWKEENITKYNHIL
jgi:hypothetical protein